MRTLGRSLRRGWSRSYPLDVDLGTVCTVLEKEFADRWDVWVWPLQEKKRIDQALCIQCLTLRLTGMNATHTTVVTASSRTATLRRVFVTFPHVAPPGASWTADHGGRHFELTSFKGGAVELYVRDADGIYMYQGNVRDYAPGAELCAAFRAAWYSAQPSKAARASFEASALPRASVAA